MSTVKPETLIQNPENVYNSPAELLRDRRLTEKDKLKALESWEADLRAQLRADDENMTAAAPQKSAPEETIKKVQKAERLLKDEEQ